MTTRKTKNEDWINRKWRPLMGMMYFTVCIFDFILFPILWALFQQYLMNTHTSITKIEPWDPLTLQGAGLFHMAMGAVLGIAAWSRGQEKMSMSMNVRDTMNNGYTDNSQYYEESEQMSVRPVNKKSPAPAEDPER